MPKKPFLKKLFKKNKFNPKNTSYNKEVIDLQKHALTNPISMSEAENDIETSYTVILAHILLLIQVTTILILA